MEEKEYKVPNILTKEYLDDLASGINGDQLSYLYEVANSHQTEGIRVNLKDQIPETEKIFDDLSSLQYFEQTLKIGAHLTVKFRTIETSSNDQSIKFALRESKRDDSNYDLFWRVRNRKRLSYALKEINDRPMCAENIDGGYLEYILSGVDINKELDRVSEQVYKSLMVMPEVLVEKINNYFGIWESIVYERIRKSDMEKVVKN